MKQSASPSRRLKHRKQPPEYKAPRSSFASVAGCLTDDLQGGVRITRTCISNLTTWTEETKTPPAFVQTDGDSTIAYENASASPWGVPTCSGAGGVNDPFTDKQKIASRAGETKNPPADFRKGWRGLSNYQTTKIDQRQLWIIRSCSGAGRCRLLPSWQKKYSNVIWGNKNHCQTIFYLFVLLNLSLLNSSQVGFGFGNCSHSIFNFFRSSSKNALELMIEILQPDTDKQKTRSSQSQCGAEVIALKKQLCSIVKTAKKTWPTAAFCGLLIFVS